jgi:hypothetical protein
MRYDSEEHTETQHGTQYRRARNNLSAVASPLGYYLHVTNSSFIFLLNLAGKD